MRAAVLALVLVSSSAAADPMGPFYCRQTPCAIGASMPAVCVDWCEEDEIGGASPAAKRRAAVVEPRVQLLVSPRLALCFPGRPVLVRAQVLIEDPGPRWYCPKVTFEWAEGHRSSVEGDCPPYDELSHDQRKWFRLARTMRYGCGEHEVVVTVAQGAERIQLSRLVTIQ